MINPARERSKVGELRPSQLLHTFGVGAIVELPHLSVMVMGLDDWQVDQYSIVINEPRLLRAVQEQLGPQVAKLYTPPVTPESASFSAGAFDESASVGVPVAPFPRWMLCPYCRLLAPIQSGLFELKLDPFRRDRSRYLHKNCGKTLKPPIVVPSRFLVACENGHLDDFPWVEYVHRGKTECKYQLQLYELGASGEVADIQVHCVKCDMKRRMSYAFGPEAHTQLGKCRGRMPHLRTFAEKDCHDPQKAILLGASNSWFPITLSALSLPVSTDKLGQLVEQHWDDLQDCGSLREVQIFQKFTKKLKSYTAEEIWEAINKKRDNTDEESDDPLDLYGPEWKIFTNPDPKLNSRNFQLRQVAPPRESAGILEKVVLVEKLREVQSLISFSRIESAGYQTELGDFPVSKRVPLCRKPPKWVPTSEVRGEGIFLQFSEKAIQNWLSGADLLEGEFLDAHADWRETRKLDPKKNYPGLRFVFLHSLAHALIRQFSLECGYATASIRERIYSREEGEDGEPMAGILLYTAAPDSEGTLGGLVSLGEPVSLGRHLGQALEEISLCASDPLCAEHRSTGSSLHGAACHACLFLPETSCTRGNKYLDRSVLVSTLDRSDFAFFKKIDDAIPDITLNVTTNQKESDLPPVPESPDFADLVDLCDERCSDFVLSWCEKGFPYPEIGFELQDKKVRICADAELAWPEKKVAVLLTEKMEDAPRFQAQGWTVFDVKDLETVGSQLIKLVNEQSVR